MGKKDKLKSRMTTKRESLQDEYMSEGSERSNKENPKTEGRRKNGGNEGRKGRGMKGGRGGRCMYKNLWVYV